MKNTNHILKLLAFFTLSALVISSCGGAKDEISIQAIIDGGNMDEIRSKKKELSDKQKALETDIALLDSVINESSGQVNIPLVTTYKAEEKEFFHFIELQGDVTTKQNVLVYPEVPGMLVKVNVREGQRVAKGEVIGVVDNGGLTNQLSQMKTQLALAKTTYERQERMFNQKVGSEIQYLQAKANFEAQSQSISQMEQQLDKYNIRAPFSGIIDDVIKDQGTVVSPGPGSEVFRIVNLSDMYIEVAVPETYLTGVTKGKNVKVIFPILGETIESKVRQTSNFINPNNRSFNVEIPVPNKEGKIKPNLTARVHINDYQNEKAILVPQSVISENAEGEQYAFLASEINSENVAKVTKSIIETGKTQGDFVEVLSGISNGQSIIQEGARTVKDGQEVKILNL